MPVLTGPRVMHVSTSAAGHERPAMAVAPDVEAPRPAAEFVVLAADLRHLAPPGPCGERALAAIERLLDLPEALRPAALPGAFEEFALACAAAAPDPDRALEELCSLVRERHASLLADRAFAFVVEARQRRAGMLAWLLRQNVAGLGRARAELHARADEIARLREERRCAEAQLRVLEDDLCRSRMLADRGLCAAGLAHDFNNLLQAILAHASIALDRLPEGDSTRPALEQILEVAGRASELSRGLSRWDHCAPVAALPAELNPHVEYVLELLAASTPGHVEVRPALAARLPRAAVDPTDLRRIVLNLVMNAWQAIGPRPGTVRVATGTAGDDAGRLVYVEVEDDGPGIADDVRARLFEPFHTTRERGLGLGLANVRLLVERSGGRIEVWSGPGQGARFRASFPVAG